MMLLLPAFVSTPDLNKVYNVDALTLLSAIKDNTIDMVLCSPPYDSLRTYNGYSFDFQPIARETYRVLKPGGVCVWVIDDAFLDGSKTLTSFKQALYFKEVVGFNLHQRITWIKEGLPHKRPNAYLEDTEDMYVFSKGTPKTFNPMFKRNKRAGEIKRKGHSGIKGFSFADGHRVVPEESLLTNVWLMGVGLHKTTSDDIDHPAMFPEELARRHIETWTNPGDGVLDYFGGSGTTAKMARQYGRDYITCDISLEYCDLMRKRLAMPFTPNMFAADVA